MEKNVVPVFIGKKKLEDMIKVPVRKKYRYRSRNLHSLIRMECDGLSEDEQKEIRLLLKRMQSKRKQNMEPCLLFDVRFQ